MAQIYGVTLDPAAFVLIVLTVVGASIGSPSTPGVGIVILAGILASIGIPAEGVAILLGVDRLLDMCRTAVNVSGDLTTSVVMQRWIGDDIQQASVTVEGQARP
jgi:Na+/H+-dicarboxylate symporter